MRLFDVKISFEMICSTGSSYTYLPFKKLHSKGFRFYFFSSLEVDLGVEQSCQWRVVYLNYHIQESIDSIKSFAAPLNTSLMICGTRCIDII